MNLLECSCDFRRLCPTYHVEVPFMFARFLVFAVVVVVVVAAVIVLVAVAAPSHLYFLPWLCNDIQPCTFVFCATW